MHGGGITREWSTLICKGYYMDHLSGYHSGSVHTWIGLRNI